MNVYPNASEFRRNRKVILEKANYKCEDCGIGGRIEAHHLDLSKDNHSIENLKALCTRCHINNYHERSYPKHLIGTTETSNLICNKCGHTWRNRLIRKPKACPRCKRYDWEEEAPKGKGK